MGGRSRSPVPEPVARCEPLAITIDSAATGPLCRLAAETVPLTAATGRAGSTHVNAFSVGVCCAVVGHAAVVGPVHSGGSVTLLHVVPPLVVRCTSPAVFVSPT